MAYATISKPSLHFNTVLYTGTGSENAITGVNHQPDFVWLKRRDSTGSHRIFDAVRGATKEIFTDATNVESTTAESLKSFDSDGFTMGTDAGTNGSSRTFASWNLKANGSGSSNSDGAITSTVSANTTAGFSIVTYTGTGSTTTVGHGLGVKPDLVIYKERNNANSWRVMTDVSGTLKRLYLNATDVEASIIDSSTAPTSTVLNIGTGSEVNRSSGTFVAYCFASKKGFSKFGEYTGNGNADGPFIYTGFKPGFIIYKGVTGSADNWEMHDIKREPANPVDRLLYPNATSAESDPASTTDRLDILSNGFKMRTGSADYNNSGTRYLWMAFAAEPLVANVGASIPATAN